MSRCKFTIITVCYNAEKYIEDTINSVLSQTYGSFEYIIKDGQSGDGTMDIVHRLTDSDNRVMIIQGKDRGIYDAMNIAVKSACGEYILFLNAGDKFADENVLFRASESIRCSSADILYGNIVEIDEGSNHLRIYTEKNSQIWYYSLGACLCHQVMFCKRELFQKKLFDISYKVCSDREWQLYHIKNGASVRAMNVTIAEVLVDGFSKEHVNDLEEETMRCVKQYCGRWYIMYRILMLVKKNKMMTHIIRMVEKRISCK